MRAAVVLGQSVGNFILNSLPNVIGWYYLSFNLAQMVRPHRHNIGCCHHFCSLLIQLRVLHLTLFKLPYYQAYFHQLQFSSYDRTCLDSNYQGHIACDSDLSFHDWGPLCSQGFCVICRSRNCTIGSFAPHICLLFGHCLLFQCCQNRYNSFGPLFIHSLHWTSKCYLFQQLNFVPNRGLCRDFVVIKCRLLLEIGVKLIQSSFQWQTLSSQLSCSSTKGQCLIVFNILSFTQLAP